MGIMSKSALPWLRVIALSALVLLTVVAFAQGTPKKPEVTGPKRLVAISSFEVKLGVPQSGPQVTVGASIGNTSASGTGQDGTIAIANPDEFSQGLTDMLVTALVGSNLFRVLDPGAGAAGDSLAPQFLIRASVTEMTCRFRQGGGGIGGVSFGQGSYENKVVLDVRLVDPLTNEVIESVRAEGKKSSKSSILGAEKYKGGSLWNPGRKLLDLKYADYASSPLYDATRLSVEDAVKRLRSKILAKPWEAGVVSVVQEEDGLDLYLNLDGESGLKLGDTLELYRLGNEIRDATTGRVLGRTKPKLLGLLQVTSTEETFVIARPTGEISEDILTNSILLVVRQPKPKK